MRKRRNGDSVVITDNNGLDLAGAMNQQTNTAIEFSGDGGQGSGSFSPEDLFRNAFFLRKPFEIANLFGFKSCGIAGYSSYKITLLKNQGKSTGSTSRCTRERNNIADILHAGNKLH